MGLYIKNKYEKKLMLMQVHLEQAQQHLVERDKEIKLYRLKLKELMQTNLSGLTSQHYLEGDSLVSPKPQLLTDSQSRAGKLNFASMPSTVDS